MPSYTPKPAKEERDLLDLRRSSSAGPQKSIIYGALFAVVLLALVGFGLLVLAPEPEPASPLPELGAAPLATTTTVVVEAAPTTAAPTTEAPEPTTTTTTEPPEPVNPTDIRYVFVDRTPGDTYGLLGYVTPAGARRTVDGVECRFVDYTTSGGVCLNFRGFGGTLSPGLAFDSSFSSGGTFDVAISPDGGVFSRSSHLAAGGDLGIQGGFEASTSLVQLETGRSANLFRGFEFLTTTGEGYYGAGGVWCASFVNDAQFYVSTGGIDGEWVGFGQTSTSEIQLLYPNASCPSVSPDARTVVAFSRVDGVASARLVAIDTATGSRRTLEEARNVVRQVEWLDNSTILYEVERDERNADGSLAWDVWSLNINGGSPVLFLENASSPAVP